MKIDYKKHNEYVLNLPRYKIGKDTPSVIPESVADKIVEWGKWEEYKNYVVVSEWMPTSAS